MIVPLNTTSSSYEPAPVRYMIAQHMPNPLRKEPRNVGIVVEKDGDVIAQFIGEPQPGEWDASRLRVFPNPNAYRLWVDHWRKLTNERKDNWMEELQRSRGQEFAVINGGEITATGADSAREVCGYLYGLLVGGGLSDALGMDSADEQVPLKQEIGSAFREAGILGDTGGSRHPVFSGKDVRGQHKWHPITYYQESGADAWAMEPVDFTVVKKRGSRDHAAYARYVFSDLRERSNYNGLNINTIALVRARKQDKENPDVLTGLEILEGTCSIVDWFNPRERQSFVNERISVALSA